MRSDPPLCLILVDADRLRDHAAADGQDAMRLVVGLDGHQHGVWRRQHGVSSDGLGQQNHMEGLGDLWHIVVVDHKQQAALVDKRGERERPDRLQVEEVHRWRGAAEPFAAYHHVIYVDLDDSAAPKNTVGERVVCVSLCN